MEVNPRINGDQPLRKMFALSLFNPKKLDNKKQYASLDYDWINNILLDMHTAQQNLHNA